MQWNTCGVMQRNIYTPTTKRATCVLYVYVEGGLNTESHCVFTAQHSVVYTFQQKGPVFPQKRALDFCQRALYLHLQFLRL